MAAGGEPQGEVAEFLRGDPSAMAVVCEAVNSAVRGFQFSDPALSQELSQEALARIFLSLNAGRFRGDSSLGTYAARVARYTCLEHLRRRRLEVDLDADSFPSRERWSQPEESFLGAEEHLRNLETFARLPADCRELLRMVFADGLSYREIALRLGISVGAIKTRVHRCRAALRERNGTGSAQAGRPQKRRMVQWE
jgi:RNA polymerase sigma-70 factor (ECF subfamily)